MTPETKFPSPTGRYVFRVYPWEVRMSLWIDTPELFDLSTQQPLFRLTDARWTLDTAEWESDFVVTITLRKYPGDHFPPAFVARINCEKQAASVDGATNTDLAHLERTLERLYVSGRKG